MRQFRECNCVSAEREPATSPSTDNDHCLIWFACDMLRDYYSRHIRMHIACVCDVCVSVCQARYSCISIVDRLFIFWLWISCANQHSVNFGFGWAQMLCSTNVNWMERWICVRRWFIHRKCLNWLHFGKCCCDCFKCIVAQHRGYEYIFCVTLPHTSIGVDWSQCHWPMKILLHTMPAVNSNSQRIINHY